MMATRDDLSERIAVLSSRVDGLAQAQAQYHDDARGEREKLFSKLDSLSNEMTHYKGMLGGIALLASCIVVALGIAKGWLFGK